MKKIRPKLKQILNEISARENFFGEEELNCLFKQIELCDWELQLLNNALDQNVKKIHSKFEHKKTATQGLHLGCDNSPTAKSRIVGN